MSTGCVILAAGLSSRMGMNKMLLEIDGITVIERCIHAFYESCVTIIVVTGKYHNEIQDQLAHYPKVHLVYNKDYQQGMFSSVKAGIKFVEAERFFLTPGDYPLLTADLVRYMLQADGNYIVPVYQGKQGHPVLLHKQLVPFIVNSTSNSLRDCLHDFMSEKRELTIGNEGILRDMDTAQEYAAISKRFLRYQIKTPDYSNS